MFGLPFPAVFDVSAQVEVAMRTDGVTGVDFPVALGADLGIPLFFARVGAEKQVAPLGGKIVFCLFAARGFEKLVADTENAQNRAVGTLPVFRNGNRNFCPESLQNPAQELFFLR